jgi:phenylpyruvate tautomerase PptA (4-oxalocrotonate tautomerase family)
MEWRAECTRYARVTRTRYARAMPAATIEVRRPYTQAQEIAILDAVHAAMQGALQLLPHDRNLRLIVHEPHRFAAPGDLSHPEQYTFISIDLFAGRSIDAKRALYRALVAAMAPFEVRADHVKIVLRETARDNWGIRGGQAACDVDLGFKIDI